jgi:hypothetical protein
MKQPLVHTDARIRESLHEMPTTKLMAEIGSKVALLVNKEVELARTEIKNDLNAELASIKRIGVGVVAALITINMLMVAAVFGLAPYLGGAMAALALAAVALVIALVAGGLGWSKFVTNPLVRTRRTLREDLQWTKEKMA